MAKRCQAGRSMSTGAEAPRAVRKASLSAVAASIWSRSAESAGLFFVMPKTVNPQLPTLEPELGTVQSHGFGGPIMTGSPCLGWP